MKKPRLNPVRYIGQIVLLLVLAGCAVPSMAGVPRPSALPAATDAAVATPRAPAATTDTTTPAPETRMADRLWVTGTDEYGVSRLFLQNGATGNVERTLPGGYITPDWSTLYQVATVENTTTIRAYEVATGRLLRETTLNGQYDVPGSYNDLSQSAFSPDGRWLMLVQRYTDAEYQKWQETGKPRSRMVVLGTSFGPPPQRVDLEGDFWFDALSAGGDSLYLIQSLSPHWPAEEAPNYQVRRYDLATGRLDEQPVVDKRETGPMTGGKLTSLAPRGGAWLYSLYTRANEGPFVHVLNLNDRYAVCVDLPFPAVQGDFESGLMWSLALSPDESILYAVNAALGQVAAINTQTFEVRSATLPQPKAETSGLLASISRWLMPVAEAKRLIVGGAAVSPDGQTLYALNSDGLVAIATNDLSLRGRLANGWALSSLALSAKGDALYAVAPEKGKILRLDLAAAGPSPVEVNTTVRPMAILQATDGR